MYTLIAQDDLNTLGFSTGGLDGIFGANTENAVKRYQTSRGLASDRNCWLQYLAFTSRKRYWYSEELLQHLTNYILKLRKDVGAKLNSHVFSSLNTLIMTIILLTLDFSKTFISHPVLLRISFFILLIIFFSSLDI